jgi:hypothetical protein
MSRQICGLAINPPYFVVIQRKVEPYPTLPQSSPPTSGGRGRRGQDKPTMKMNWISVSVLKIAVLTLILAKIWINGKLRRSPDLLTFACFWEFYG